MNEKILKIIDELTDDKAERAFCKKILREELLYSDDASHDFRGQLRTWMQKDFPFEDKK